MNSKGVETVSMFAIDTSKATLSTCLVDPATKRKLWSRDVANNARGIEVLLHKTAPDVPWVIEPTGRYSQTAARMATEAGKVVQPHRSRQRHSRQAFSSAPRRILWTRSPLRCLLCRGPFSATRSRAKLWKR